MLWNDHSRDIQKGDHAFLGASRYSWLNYDEDRLKAAWKSQYATVMGTILHELASNLIDNKIKITKRDTHLVLYKLLENYIPRCVIDLDRIMDNLVPYVYDGIGYRMMTEQILYYSENCFGTADSIIFDEKKRLLRIHDYKSGETPAKMEQLIIYDALFCLEYGMKPGEIDHELRIYQFGDQLIANPSADDILPVMDKIVRMDELVDSFKEAK